MSGTIVYVHGASDRATGVDLHLAAIATGLATQGAAFDVVAARWGETVGPTLDGVLRAVPEVQPRTADPVPATQARGMSRIVQGLAAGVVALQYVNVRAPGPVRVWATDRLLVRRDRLMMDILGVADALVYQRHGDPIRAAVREVLAAIPDAGRPLIALGNSLGGIILVDLLREVDAPRPDLLVTAGSQSGVLQSFGALGPVDDRPPFQPWLNIYDRRDLVAFLARPLWPDQAGITDHRVDLRKGFPEVHGPAYLEAAEVWRTILAHPALGQAQPPG